MSAELDEGAGTARVCDYCEATFEAEDPADLRCPKCLRRQAARARSMENLPSRPALDAGHLWLFAICAAAVGGVGYLALRGPGALGSAGKSRASAAVERAQKASSVRAAKEALAAGDTKEAYRQAEEVLKSEPKNPEAREVVGDTLLKSGASAEALKEYEAALAIKPTGGRHRKAAQALVAMGDSEAAGDHFRRALKLSPDAAWASQVRSALADMGGALGEGLKAAAGRTGDDGSADGRPGGAPPPP